MIDFNVIKKLTALDSKTLIERALKLSEENGEVSEAILSYVKANGCEYKNKTKEDVIEECLDVIIVASSIISQVNDNVDVEHIYKCKLKKWEEKCK
ncbi:hypothetical protein CHF27_010740 [Romboutsia maritimum]|uniref:NTP pyrophosphohydrolase MazG putative catalytic core domain-containing protein n=1 Tax=Romboutsia maritimum TaxID=2020948 RepID=A0A371IR80_9FIRM|nr:MazG-like family protein [Romboutsia maritimum]RDY22974.1 hypothetical protein CHF27_010740 [Romboutsia maritimum]